MPRRIFAAGSVTNATGAPLRLEFYPTSTSARREADLWTIDGSNNLVERISNGVIVTSSSGAYSAFAGPDDLDTLYALPNNTSTRTTLTASDYVSSSLDGAVVRRRSGTTATAALLTSANAKDYGAVGDGVTDDTAALQAFLTAWGTAGGDFVIPKGTYLTTAMVTASPTVAGRLYGYGATIKVGATFPSAIAAYAMLSITGSNVAVHGLTLDGNSLANRGIRIGDGSAQIRIYDCEVKNIAQQATETDLNAVGIRIGGNCSDIDIERCYVHGIVAGGGGLASFARGVLISDPNSAGVSTNIKIRDCTFTDITFTGISIDADGICIQNWSTNTYLLVDGCYFKNLYKRAVKIQSPGVTVTRCTVENNYTGASGVNTGPQPQVYSAISVYANDCIISNNNIFGGAWFIGIEIGTTASTTNRVTVSGNRVSGGSGTTLTGSAGLRIYGDNTCSEFLITGNYFGRFVEGIWLSTAASGVVITGNQINAYSVASTSGIFIDGQSSVQPTRLTVVGNSVEGNTRYGIETSIVPTDMIAAGNMAGRGGFEVISSSAFGTASRNTFAIANAGAGSVSAGTDGTQGSNLKQGTVSARIVKFVNTITYSSSMTPDSKLGDWHAITVTNGTAMTINAPTNPPSSTQTQRLVVEVLNSSGGAMGVITWNAAFVFGGLAWTNPADTMKRHAMFEWNGTKWICTAVAAGDY